MFLTPLISAPVDITIMLLVAFVIGYTIAWLMRKGQFEQMQEETMELQKEIRNLHMINENLDIAKDNLKDQLKDCLDSKENLVSTEKLQQVTMELKQERDRSETARRSLSEIENAHEAMKRELQLKLNQMMPQEEANKLRAEINRLRVFNSSMEEEIRELKKQRNSNDSESNMFNNPSNDVDTTISPGHEFVRSIGIMEASYHEKDDLKQISGVGPFIEEKLNRLGIFTFAQIASMTNEQAEKINEAIEFFPGRIQRDDWVGQARLLGATTGDDEPAD